MKTFIILITFIVLTSCASIFSKSTYTINIASNPSELKYEIFDVVGNAVESGTTPAQISLEARFAPYLVVVKNGTETKGTSIKGTIDPWFWGNLVFLNLALAGIATDSGSGAMAKIPKSSRDILIDFNIQKSQDELEMAIPKSIKEIN